jgi:hypothetical protein
MALTATEATLREAIARFRGQQQGAPSHDCALNYFNFAVQSLAAQVLSENLSVEDLELIAVAAVEQVRLHRLRIAPRAIGG